MIEWIMSETLRPIDEEIIKRLAARKFGIKFEPLPPNAPTALLDVEDAYDDTVLHLKKAPNISKVESIAFESEPE